MRKGVFAALLLVVLSLPLYASILQRDEPSPIDRLVRAVSRITHFVRIFDDAVVPHP